MIHELRVLHCVPGRLPALLRRFETDTLRLFEKHGIKQLGFWTVAIGESNNDLFLIVEWESLAEREQKFGAFLKDPEWLEARRKSLRLSWGATRRFPKRLGSSSNYRLFSWNPMDMDGKS